MGIPEKGKRVNYHLKPTAAESCFAYSDRQTIFQQSLPLELQRKEWIEEWLKDDDTTSLPTRLAASKPVQVPLDLFSKLNC